MAMEHYNQPEVRKTFYSTSTSFPGSLSPRPQERGERDLRLGGGERETLGTRLILYFVFYSFEYVGLFALTWLASAFIRLLMELSVPANRLIHQLSWAIFWSLKSMINVQPAGADPEKSERGGRGGGGGGDSATLPPYPQHNRDSTILFKRRLVTIVFRINRREKGDRGAPSTLPLNSPMTCLIIIFILSQTSVALSDFPVSIWVASLMVYDFNRSTILQSGAYSFPQFYDLV